MAARAANPQSYKVDFTATGNGSIDATLRATSELDSLRKTAPVSPFGLIARARVDLDRLRVVLESYGYYQGAVQISIEGQDLAASGLADRLVALPSGTDAHVKVTFTLGPQYRLRRIQFEGDVPAGAQAALGLKTGQPAVAADVIAAGARLQTALENQGYAFAKVDPPVAFELPASRELDLTFHAVTGPLTHIGEIQIHGLQHMRRGRTRSLLNLHAGELYSAAKVDKARRNLLDTGVFASVDATLGPHPDAQGRVPLIFTVVERRLHAVSVNGAYSSDLGGSAGVTWSNRNIFGRGEQLNLSASVIDLGGDATNGMGYDASAKLVIPGFLQGSQSQEQHQSLQLSLDAIKQSLVAYDQEAVTAAVTFNRDFSRTWGASAGVSGTREDIKQPEELPILGQETFHYTMIALPLTLRYDSTDLTSPLDDATHGVRGSLSVAPTLSLGPPDATFIIMQARLATYLDLDKLFKTGPGRTVLALRALSGYAEGASVIDLPPDQRFYAGGSGTIRGYRFQSVGQQFADGTPVGGVTIDAVSAELRQRIGTSFGTAVFLDGGHVGETATPFSGQLVLGTGAGVRYYTPIGPLRIDLGFPIHRRPNDDHFEVYIGLGQAF